MSVPDMFSTICKTCGCYNLIDAILIDGELYCDSCVKRGRVKFPQWLTQSLEKEKSK